MKTEVEKKAVMIMFHFQQFENVLKSQGPKIGVDFSQVQTESDFLKSSLETLLNQAVEKSKEKPEPRAAKEILEEIAQTEKLTPELLDEIKRAAQKRIEEKR